ncbi:MAG: hypothetical protein HOP29_08820 [Phycisphaerales bacterium]|nr:hypothetical protein [Phycisphaerales bacterium]
MRPDDLPGDGASDAAGITFRSVPEVLLDRTVHAVERRYKTGVVPVAVSTNTFDQGVRLLRRVETATDYSDCFVARPRMDWEAFGPDGDNQLIDDLVAAVNRTRERGNDCIVIEIDPVSDRRNVGHLPPELQGRDFSDPLVTEPIKRMALQAAIQLRPTYLSLGVEINGYYEAHPDDFLNFVALHHETYDEIKAAAPQVQVIAAFNLESMQGFFTDLDAFSDHEPHWFLIDMFEPKLDAVAFSTLPFPLFIRPILIPDDYLSRIELHTARDILFTEMGWPGDPLAPVHTPQAQAEYVALMARLLDNMSQVRLATWASLFDPDLGRPDDLHPDFRSLGLLDINDDPKLGLEVWKAIHDLPYRP